MPKKQVAFDLDTKILRRVYPRRNWHSGYKDIKKFMKGVGFAWQQGSVYVSKNTIISNKLMMIIYKLTQDLPWINLCMRDCKQTNIGKDSDVNSFFDKKKIIKKPTTISKGLWFGLKSYLNKIKRCSLCYTLFFSLVLWRIVWTFFCD